MKFRIAIIISALIHGSIVLIVADFGRSTISIPLGESIVAVEIIGVSPKPAIPKLLPQTLQSQPRSEIPQGAQMVSASPTVEERTGSQSGDPVLTKIRNKIERAKYYPSLAKRQRIEGRAQVSFQIEADGSIAGASIKESSGNTLLDDAAIETLHRASPLPYYDGPITIAIKFSL